MNVELLRKIAAVIQEKPAEFDMAYFTNETTCGTTHCIGGWAQVLSGFPANDDPRQMASLLGIEFIPRPFSPNLPMAQCQAGRLFLETGWPTKFAGPYNDSRNLLEQARLAAARIEHFIESEAVNES